MNKDSKIFLAGHTGMVGSALFRSLTENGYTNIITKNLEELNLINQSQTETFFQTEKPEYVLLAAARVGGIWANNIHRAQFIYENIQIQSNVIHFAWKYGVKKLLFLGSSCIYPAACPQPIKEDYLLTDPLEYTNEPYAIAKIAGLRMCESYNIQYNTNFICAMPTNLFGINDNYDLESSHVLPALIRKMHLAKMLQGNDIQGLKFDLTKRPVSNFSINTLEDIETLLSHFGIVRNGNEVVVRLWGSGSPLREFLDSDSLAEACLFLMENVDFKHILSLCQDSKKTRNTQINIGSGYDITIKELADIINKVTGFNGRIEWDNTKPDGTHRKLLDISRLKQLGWNKDFNLMEKISQTYQYYINS